MKGYKIVVLAVVVGDANITHVVLNNTDMDK